MKTIELTQGKVTVVDDDVWEWASKLNWFAAHCHGTWYARREVILGRTSGGKRIRHTEHLHRMIIGDLTEEVLTDHKDGDGLNNLRSNLRPCTHGQNVKNVRVSRINNKTGFKGVSFKTANRRYQAQIELDGRNIYLGLFDSTLEAAKAYNTAAVKYHGEFARLNTI